MNGEAPPYHINGLTGSQPQYPAQQHQHQQQQQNPTPRRFPEGGQESNTLPPINGLSNPYAMYNQNGSTMLPGSAPGSMPHTPITPHSTLGGASSAPPDANFNTQTLQQHRPIGPPYPQQYQTSQSIAAAPSSSLAPTPQPYGAPLAARGQYPPHLLAHNNQLKQEPEVTHVVGQQGRRGILPSAPGRAPPSGKTAIPQKDENGKFPCPHCTKTYLHAKHLKRHMLRRKYRPLLTRCSCH